MTWILTWLNVSVTTLNATVQLLIIYRYKQALVYSFLINAIHNFLSQILTWYQSTLLYSRFFFSFSFVFPFTLKVLQWRMLHNLLQSHNLSQPLMNLTLSFCTMERIQARFLLLNLQSMTITLVGPSQCEELWEQKANQDSLVAVFH